mmetsp:Transcript_31709/g.104928  ORF Transcript_31709/g.104928 Transcript_31709/m.104928 type:complete len:129 (-) Transcript_31709:123-509(-)
MQHSATHPTAALPCTPPPRAHTRCAEGCDEGETAYRETAEPATPLPRTLQVGVAPLAPGSVAVSAAEAGFWSSATAKFLWILDGVLFLTNADGSSRRCVAGDTAVLPAGWTGLVDTVQPARVVWVDVD